jgi:glycosyltransferase involved in cell wall biosynthesis
MDEKLFPCRHFVDNARFAASAAANRARRGELRAKWGIAPDAVVPLFVGKLVPIKRVSDLIEAASICRREVERLHLLIVGTGPEEATLRGKSESLGVAATFAGFLNQSEIARAYAAADFLVLPSESETWGLVVNEAMACGLPAIVSDQVGCAPDLVIEGDTGSVFPMGDIAELGASMMRFASDIPRILRMGEHARKRVREDYDVGPAVEGTIAALRYAVGS